MFFMKKGETMCEDEQDEALCSGTSQTGRKKYPDPVTFMVQSAQAQMLLWRLLWAPWTLR